MTRGRSRTIRAAGVALSAAAIALAAGCAGTSSQRTEAGAEPIEPTDEAAPSPGPGFDRLERLAARQAHRPAWAEISGAPRDLSGMPAPQHLEGERRDRAFAPLDAVLDELTAGAEPTPEQDEAKGERDPGDGPAVDPDAALRLYAAGRQARLEGDADTAITLLEQAAELDPASPTPLRELAEAQRDAGLIASSMVSLADAAELGLDEPRGLAIAGLDALRRGQHERAARLLARALRSGTPDADPVVALAARAGLGEALLELGYLQAGAEALELGTRLPESLNAPTRMLDALGTLHRRRGELLTLAGDTRARLGELDLAAEAYSRAAEVPSLDPDAVHARRLDVALRLGRPAEAALLLLRRTLEQDGIYDERQLDLLGLIAEKGGLGRALPMAVADVDRAIPARSATIDAMSLRAGAAALPRQDRPDRLAESWSAASGSLRPSLDEIAGDLLKALEPEPKASPREDEDRSRETARDQTRAAIDLVRRRPLAWRPVASTLVERAAHARALFDALLDGSSAPPGALLLAGVLLELQRPADALAALPEPIPREDDATDAALRLAAAIEEARAGAAMGAGAWDQTDLALSRLRDLVGVGQDPENEASPQARRALVRAAATAQRFSLAIEAAEPLLKAQAPAAEDLVNSAQVAVFLDDHQRAASLHRRAVEADPYDERPYGQLLGLHGSSGALADPERLRDVARELRERLPASRVLRFLAARELIERGRLHEAERRLLDVFDETPTDGPILQGLLHLAQQSARIEGEDDRTLDRLGELVRDEAERRPLSAPLARAAAALDVLSQRYDRALQRIAAFAEASGSPALEELREQIIREGLGDPGRADEFRDARLAARPLPLAGVLEAVLLYARVSVEAPSLDALRDAADLIEALPRWIEFTDEQDGRLSQAIAALASSAQRAAGNDSQPVPAAEQAAWADETARLINASADAGLTLGPPLHRFRIERLVQGGAPVPPVLEATELAARQHPDLAAAFFATTANILLAVERRDLALALLRRASLSDDPATGSPGPRREPLGQWLRLVAMSGSPDEGRDLIRALDSVGGPEVALRALRGDASDDQPDREFTRAEIAYTLANYAQALDLPSNAEPFYRLALELDPEHPWAANDLGYNLLIRDDPPMPEVARLIELAHAALPDRAAITDSAGWLRYRQGVIQDETDFAGRVVREGAVTLLRRAVEQIGDGDDGVVHDHLGDALYRDGQTADAIQAWREARRLTNAALAERRALDQTDTPRVQDLRQRLQQITAKLGEVRAGREPALAPLAPGVPDPLLAGQNGA